MTDNQITDPDLVKAVPVIFLLDQWIEKTQEEIASKAWMKFGKDSYPHLSVLRIQLRSHALDFPDKLASYDVEEKKIGDIYGNAIDKKFVLYFKEAESIFKLLLRLWHDIGPGMIDERFAYYEERSPDYVDLVDWGEDK